MATTRAEGTGVVLAVFLALAITIVPAYANFHVMNLHKTKGSPSQGIYVVPSNKFNCGGLDTGRVIAPTQYPDCNAGYLHIPDGQCGWSGVTIKPSCSGNYFGKLFGNSGEPQGDCYWNDAGSTFNFICKDNSPVFDRLICYSAMCGGQASSSITTDM